MAIRSALWNRLSSSAGLICLAMTLLLWPAGVRSVRADDESKEAVSEDLALPPSRVATSEKSAVVLPVTKVGDAQEMLRPDGAGSQDQDGVVVLNTRGFNYGPSPANLAPVAVGHESKTP